jgi:hypothetical protein
MARKPAPQPPSGGSADDQREQASSAGAQRELAGPVAIARYVKDDGRALILYSRVPGAAE